MDTPSLIGREPEIHSLQQLLLSKESEFLAVYGRRRVGKTFLVREFYLPKTHYFELTGQKDASLAEQLHHFSNSFTKYTGQPIEQKLQSWIQALDILAEHLEATKTSKKHVIFFDELPWLCGRRSKFLSSLDYFWNSRVSKCPHVILVVCGSSASWMVDKIIAHKGGLHNRLTQRMVLMPFTLGENKAYLNSRGLNWTDQQIIELSLCTGGVPHYLRQVQKGMSAAQNIDHMAFSSNGFLRDEFDKLFSSLFNHSDTIISIIHALAKVRSGMTRQTLLEKTGLASSGEFSKSLNALEHSGFIQTYESLKGSQTQKKIKMMDEFSLFHLTFIDKAHLKVFKAKASGYWIQQSTSRSYQSWAGFAFEALCFKHIHKIKDALGIGAVYSIESSWAHRDTEEGGAQIDLLIERSDRCYSLCEIKYCQAEFVINKSYAANLRHKKETLQMHGKKGYPIFLVMITSYGVKTNSYSEELVDHEVLMSDLI